MKKENDMNVIKLQDMGSFYIGGQKITFTDKEVREVIMTPGGEPVKFDLNNSFHVGNMYVQYYIPLEICSKFPLLLWHGGGLTGAVYESTPDGRKGWLSYFLTKGWMVYNSDAVERGRAGWLPYHSIFSKEPLLFPEYYPYKLWRIGEDDYDNGNCTPYKHSKFPIEHYDNLIKQLVPSWIDSHESSINAYKELIKRNNSSIIIAHSQGATYAFKVAEELPDQIKAIIAIEPGMGGDLKNAKKLKNIPILALYGDSIKKSERWTKILNRTKEYYDAIEKSGGSVDVVMLPDEGFRGNSHLMMMDKNNMEIAEYIQKWIENQSFISQ